MTKTLAIIGAGPKAAAIVARATVLRKLSPSGTHPNIVVIERTAPGSTWSGDTDFTSGYLTLCSPAEKDVGFPYPEPRARCGIGRSISQTLFGEFSWSAFMVATGRYAEWIDRGREFLSHQLWAKYVKWVFDVAGQPLTIGEVTRVSRHSRGGWTITFQSSTTIKNLNADGVVFTGTGIPRRLTIPDKVPANNFHDAESFWASRDQFLRLRDASIIVVGDGGGAGAIVSWLADTLKEAEVIIKSVSTMGLYCHAAMGTGL